MEQAFGSISAVLSGLGPNETVTRALVFAAWKRSAGEPLSDRTATIEFVDGRLIIAVKDNTWRRHLEDLAPQFVARLNARLGDGMVKFIEFRIDASALVERRPSPSVESKSLVPNSVAEAARQIENEALREKFLDAAASYLAAKK